MTDRLLPDGVGNTPLIEVEGVFAKLECMNPCGSVKDRIASYILTEAKRRGELKAGQAIVEATSGNTGISLAYFARMMGHPITIVMPEHMTNERKEIIRKLGAELILCSEEGSFAEAAAIRDRIAEETGAYNPDQFSNSLNVECHRLTTGQEILSQLPKPVATPIAFVAGVGTGGTLIGVGEALKQAVDEVFVVAVEPKEAAVMSGNTSGTHGIFGIGDGFIPEIAAGDGERINPLISSVETVSTADAMSAAESLSKVHSFCVGVSSGANFLVAQRMRERFATVVTVFPDGHQKYLSFGLSAPVHATCPYFSHCVGNELNRLLGEIAGEPP